MIVIFLDINGVIYNPYSDPIFVDSEHHAKAIEELIQARESNGEPEISYSVASDMVSVASFDREAIGNLDKLIASIEAAGEEVGVVIHSNWRITYPKEGLQQLFQQYAFSKKIIDKTDDNLTKNPGIEKWRRENTKRYAIKDFIIIDNGFIEQPIKNLVSCETEGCFTQENLKEAIKLLSKKTVSIISSSLLDSKKEEKGQTDKPSSNPYEVLSKPSDSKGRPFHIKELMGSDVRVKICRTLFDAAAKTLKGIAAKRYGQQLSVSNLGLFGPLEDDYIQEALESADIRYNGRVREIGYLTVNLIFKLDSLDATEYEKIYGLSARTILETAGFTCSDKSIPLSVAERRAALAASSSYSYSLPSNSRFFENSASRGEDGQASPYKNDIEKDGRFKKSKTPGVLYEGMSYVEFNDNELRDYGATQWTKEKVGIDYIVKISEMAAEQQKVAVQRPGNY